MYNEERKIRFIRDITNSKASAESFSSLFIRSAPYEEQYDIDVCQFSKEQLGNIINGSGIRITTNRWRLIGLRQYNKWCEENGYEVNKDIYEFSDFDTDELKHNMVVNPSHLGRVLNCIFDRPEEETVDLVYHCYYWFLFGGATEEEAVSVLTEDINYSTMTVKGKEHDIYLYREGMLAVSKCAELDSFKYKNPNYDTIVRKRLPGTSLMRGYRGVNSSQTIKAAVSKKNSEAVKQGLTDVSLSTKKVRLSGLFYRKYELEMSGIPVNFFDLAEENIRNNNYVYTASHTRGMKRSLLNKQYTEDYNRWKMAFNLM